jgi:hypothetical protein
LILCVFACESDKRQVATGKSEIEITYISKEGFLIASKDKKVDNDCFMRFKVSPENLELMQEALPPSHDID